MRTNTNRAIWTLALLAPAVVAWKSIGRDLRLEPQSRVWVVGSSTVRGFECSAGAFEAVIATSSAATVSAVLAGEPAVTGVDFTVPAQELDCGNGTMNNHMYKALKVAEHPTITFRASSYEPTPAGANVRGLLTGELTLGGVTKPVTLEVVTTGGDDGTLLVTGVHLIRMKEFGLKPPSLMLGTLRVDEKVNVHFELYLRN